jgi:adenylate cyclase
VRRVRLATGLTLFTYVSLHLTNHSLGNISVPAMEWGMRLHKLLWQGPVGAGVLYGALATHFCLGLWAFYLRRHFGWTRVEVVQLVLGLSIPALLMNHLFATRISLALYGTQKAYAQELYSFWVGSPLFGWAQEALLVVAWTHGCIGVRQWLKLRRWYARAAPLLLCAAVTLPMLALLGFYQGGHAILAFVHDPAWRAAELAPYQIGTPAQNAALAAWRNISLLAFAGLLVLVLAARGVRAWHERHGGTIRVAYPDGRSVRVPRGFSVLDASRAGHVPHASLCGGRARCSTCRVRVVGGSAALPPPSGEERAVLERVAALPGVRLACQLRPRGDITVVPLLPPSRAGTIVHRAPMRHGEERFIVALVVDLRNSVQLADTRMPFDVVFIIDRFITAVGEAVAQAGGRVTHFTGDGLIATFGLLEAPERASRQAVEAVVHIARRIAALNDALAAEMAVPLSFGAGVHGSDAVVGEIGHAETRVFTTLGDAANLASRLEALCKEFAVQAVMSDDVCRLSGLPLGHLPRETVQLRGRATPLPVCLVRDIAELSAAIEASPSSPARHRAG